MGLRCALPTITVVVAVLVAVLIGFAKYGTRSIAVHTPLSAADKAPLNSPPLAVFQAALSFLPSVERIRNLLLLPADIRIMEIASNYWASQALYVAAKLGISDLLQSGPLTARELASAVDVNAVYLERVLRFLQTIDVFDYDAETTKWHLTSLSLMLLSDHEQSMRATVISLNEEHYDAWGVLLESVRAGETAFNLLHGQPVFDYFEVHPESNMWFNRFMTSLSRSTSRVIVEDYDFGKYSTIVDLGGGQGTLVEEILRYEMRRSSGASQLQCVVLDREHVIRDKDVIEYWDHHEFGSHVRLVVGDFFDARTIPQDADAYMMRMIIHDWNDELSIEILRNVGKAFKEKDTKLLLISQVVADVGNGLRRAHTGVDVNMMVMTGGKERTREEFESMLGEAGFKVLRIVPTRCVFSVVEAVLA